MCFFERVQNIWSKQKEASPPPFLMDLCTYAVLPATEIGILTLNEFPDQRRQFPKFSLTTYESEYG